MSDCEWLLKLLRENRYWTTRESGGVSVKFPLLTVTCIAGIARRLLRALVAVGAFHCSLPRASEADACDGRERGQRATSSEREEALLRMLCTIASLVDRMQNEVASEPLYATE